VCRESTERRESDLTVIAIAKPQEKPSRGTICFRASSSRIHLERAGPECVVRRALHPAEKAAIPTAGIVDRRRAHGKPVYVQLKAGHSQASITEPYIHAAQVVFPDAAERGEERLFGGVAGLPGPKTAKVLAEPEVLPNNKGPVLRGLC
jgi:hypothetical protein